MSRLNFLSCCFILMSLFCSSCENGSESQKNSSANDSSKGEDKNENDKGLSSISFKANGFEIYFNKEDCSFRLLKNQKLLFNSSSSDKTRFKSFSYASFLSSEASARKKFHDPGWDKNYFNEKVYKWFGANAVKSFKEEKDYSLVTCSSLSKDNEIGKDFIIKLSAKKDFITMESAIDGFRESGLDAFHSLNLALQKEEDFFGGGQNFDFGKSRGLIRHMQMYAEFASESGISEDHVPVPFYISTNKWAFFAEERDVGAIDFSVKEKDNLRITYQTGNMTIHFFSDDDPLKIVEQYTDLTGKPADVPFWALAPQFWRNVNINDEEIVDDIKKARKEGFPATVFWIDRPWSSYYHNFKFDEKRFPDYKNTLKLINDYGYKLLLHHSPQMNIPATSDIGKNSEDEVDEGLYDLFSKNDWIVKWDDGRQFELQWGGGTGTYIDFTHPGAIEKVTEMIKRVTDLGAIGFKMDWDEGLVSNAGGLKTIFKFNNGETSQTMKGRYSSFYHKTVFEAFEKHIGFGGFHVNRADVWGGQKWNTCIWPGDLDNDFSFHIKGASEKQSQWNVGGLPAAIIANTNLALSGFGCFASDIGGFRNGQPKKEALIRWYEFGTFNTVMQIGGGGGSHMPWTSDSKYDQETYEIARKYMKLRIELFPYIYQNLKAALNSGSPFIAPLYFHFSNDPKTIEREYEFMFGPDLLIAPVYKKGDRSRELYLPAANWYDFWDGSYIENGGKQNADAPLGKIPVYIKSGSIIPMASPEIDTLVSSKIDSVRSYKEVKKMSFLVMPGDKPIKKEFFFGIKINSELRNDSIYLKLEKGDLAKNLSSEIGFRPELNSIKVSVSKLKKLFTKDTFEVYLEKSAKKFEPCNDAIKYNCRLDDREKSSNFLEFNLSIGDEVSIR